MQRPTSPEFSGSLGVEVLVLDTRSRPCRVRQYPAVSVVKQLHAADARFDARHGGADDNWNYGVFFAGGGGVGVPKSTVGGPELASAEAVKYLRGFAPVTLAVTTAGNCRMYALY